MIVEIISKNAGADQEDYAYYPSPSKIGKCVRSLVYYAMGVKPEAFPDRAMLVFEMGHTVEDIVKEHIKKTAFTLHDWKGKKQRVQIGIINGKTMDGEIDGLLEDILGNLWLLEVKSINHFSFQRLVDTPLEEHIRQTNLYLHGLNLAGFKVPKAIILYYNKNTSQMKEFEIPYIPELAISDIELLESVEIWAKDRNLPPRPYDYGTDFPCSYCRYQTICWQNYGQELQSLTEDVALSEEIGTSVRFYKELGAQMGELKKQQDEVKETIKTALKVMGAQSGKASEYLVSLSLVEKKAFTVPASIHEQLKITKIKENKNEIHKDQDARQSKKYRQTPQNGQDSPGNQS